MKLNMLHKHNGQNLKQMDNRQGTMEWLRERLGNATSSQIFKLMTEPRSKSDEWSVTAYSYIMERVGERLTGEPIDTPTTFAMQWGIDHEPLARRWVERTHNCIVTESHYVPCENLDHYGGSADGTFIYDGAKCILEIKCPTTAEHLKNIEYSKDVATLKLKYPELYWQMQSNMYLNGAEKGLFVSFDPRIDMACGLHTLWVDRNTLDITLMLVKVSKAVNTISEKTKLFKSLTPHGIVN